MHIHDSALVEDAVLFDNVVVEPGAVVRRAIVDKNVRVPRGFHLSAVSPDVPRGFTMSAGGVLVVGALYQRMQERGELEVFAGRVTPVGRFLRGVADRLTGERVIVAGADRYRQNEAQQALDDAGVRWPIAWRGTGASKTADGSHDVRSFQRAALSGKLFSLESHLMAHALSESAIRYDGSGNPALEKARSKGRIDVAAAVVIAAGLAELERGRKRPVRPPRLHVVGAA